MPSATRSLVTLLACSEHRPAHRPALDIVLTVVLIALLS